MHAVAKACWAMLWGWVLAAAALAVAADFPVKPIRLVVPYAPGGANDLIARAIQPRMQESLGQPVLIENRPGAGGNTGTEGVTRAPADGYTVLMGANFMAMTPVLARPPSYTLQDFVPIGRIASHAVMLAVNAQSPVRTLPEFVALARQRDKTAALAYGTPGVGSPHHLFVEQLSRKLGASFVHIPYNGSAPLMGDLIAGRIDFSLVTETLSTGPAAAGQIRQIAVLDDQRLVNTPQVPTAAESGFPGIRARFWYALFAPVQTPPAVTERLTQALRAALDDPAVRAQLVQRGFVPAEAKTRAAAMEELQAEWSEWSQLAKAGLKIGD